MGEEPSRSAVRTLRIQSINLGFIFAFNGFLELVSGLAKIFDLKWISVAATSCEGALAWQLLATTEPIGSVQLLLCTRHLQHAFQASLRFLQTQPTWSIGLSQNAKRRYKAHVADAAAWVPNRASVYWVASLFGEQTLREK